MLIDQGLIEYPNELGLLECLGRYYFEIEEYEKASEILYTVISEKPELIDAWALLSVMEMEIRKDNDKAHDILIKGLSFHKDNILLLNNLAYNYLLNDDVVESRKILDKVNASDNVYINATRGLLLIKEGNLEEGRHLYNMAETIAVQDRMLKNLIKQKKYLELAKDFYKKDRIDDAAAYLKKSLPIKTNYRYFRDQAVELLHEIEKENN